MERALSLMTLINLSTSGTFSLVALGLILVSGKSGMRQPNYLSIGVV